MDITKINLVNDSTKEEPKYELARKGISITLFFNTNNDLLIVGNVDNNFIHWASLSKTTDREQNEAIFNHIAYEPFEAVAYKVSLLRSVQTGYWDAPRDNPLDNPAWHQARLTRIMDGNMLWSTPFGHDYGKEKPAGDSFARDVESYQYGLLEKCRIREAGGAYEKVLDNCLDKMLKVIDDDYGYPQVEELIKIIDQDDYLVSSPNEQIREKYINFLNLKSQLYNQYMTRVR